VTPSASDTEKIFRKIERSPARDAARSAYAKRLGAWKARWGFVDDTVLERPASGPPSMGLGGARDDTNVGYGHKKPGVPDTKREKITDPKLAASIAEFDRKRARLRAKFAIDRSSAIDHITGEAYSRARRTQLEELTQSGGDGKPYYIASEYGMRTARDDKAELRSGLRTDHEQSAVYMRDNPGKTLSMFQQLFKAMHPERDLKNVHFVNNPNVFDKIALFLGPGALPPEGQREVEPIAPGIYAIDCPPPRDAEGYFSGTGRSAFESLLRSLGTTPSSYQGFRALHEDEGEVPMSAKTVDITAATTQLKESPSVAGLRELSDGHPMAHIAHTTAALLESLPGSLASATFDEATENGVVEARRLARAIAKDHATFESLKQSRGDPQRRKELQSAIATQGNRLDKLNGDLEPVLRARLAELEAKLGSLDTPEAGSDAEAAIGEIETALDQARKSLDEGRAGDADLALKKVPKRLNPLLRKSNEKYAKDPIVQSTLENIKKIAAGMDALKDDAARLTRLFDVMMDEVYVLLARTRPYKKTDFDRVMIDALGKRAPCVRKLKNAKPKTFVVSSGMDAITTGMVAALKNHGQDKISLNDKDSLNANYFEVSELLKHKTAIADVGDVISATLNPSTPTDRKGGPDPDQVGEILKSARAKLAKKAEAAETTGGAAAPVSLVLDATIERAADGGEAGTSELERLIGELSKPIDAGLLTLVLCKSYQKYGSLGSAKLMAGSVTVLGTDAAFARGGEFAAQSEAALDFRNNDESQLLAHLVSAGSDQELPMVKRAADNAKFVGAACLGVPARQAHNEGLPFVMFRPDYSASVEEALFKLGVENRDSFGFQNSSVLSVPLQGLRINTGQDPENALVEKFYAVGHLLNDEVVASLDPAKVKRLVDEKRAGAADTAAALLARAPQRAAEAEKDPAAKPVLDRRAALQAALAGDDAVAKLKALDEVAPLLPYYKAPDPRPKERVELDNINSIEASCHALAAMALTLKPADEADLADRMKAFIDRDMKGVSPEMRGKMITQWARLACKSNKPNLVRDTAAAAAKLPCKEDRATMVLDGLPGPAVGRLPVEDRKALLNATLNGLDIRSKLNIAESLLDANDLYKVEQIIAALKDPVRELRVFGKGDPGAQESLGANLDGDVAPDAMTREERDAIAELYKQLCARLEAARSKLEKWAPVEDGPIQKRCEAYEAILNDTDPDDPAQVEMLDNLGKTMQRARAGLDASNRTELGLIDSAIDGGRRKVLFQRNRLDKAMAKRVASVRALIDGTEAIATAENEKAAGLGDKLRELATALRQSETDVKVFLEEHEAASKGEDEYDRKLKEINKAGEKLAAIGSDDKDLADYLKRLLDTHLAAEQRRLTDGYRAKLPLTDQIEAVLKKIDSARFFQDGVRKLRAAMVLQNDTAGPLAKQGLEAIQKHRQYPKVEQIVKDELLKLLPRLPGWTV
jgi:hypothetical protein